MITDCSLTTLRRSVLLLGSLLLCAPANAFWGIGDVTFDPTSYGELITHGKQLKDTYDAVAKQLDRLDKMQQTIREASESYERLTNLNLHSVADGLNPGKYMKYATGETRLRMMRAGLQNLKNGTASNIDFIQHQLARIGDLESVMNVQAAAANNAKQASTDVDVRKSSQLSAQSTSVLAALATAEEQRRTQSDMALAEESKRQTDLLNDSAAMYRAMTPKSAAQ